MSELRDGILHNALNTEFGIPNNIALALVKFIYDNNCYIAGSASLAIYMKTVLNGF